MRVVIDGLPTTAGSSLAVIVEQLLDGWVEAAPDDELHVVVGSGARINIPESVTVHPVAFGRHTMLDRLRAQSLLVPRLCRRLRPDAMLGAAPATTVAPLPCPRAVILYDLRHELLPHQFSLQARVLRKLSYGLVWLQVDAVACISERTRRDLLRSRPWLRRRAVRVAYLGSDHVDSWRGAAGDKPYAVAFGQWGNKNADMVIDAWGLLRDRGTAMPLKLIGMPDDARAAGEAQIARLGLGELITPVGWLFGEALQRCLAAAGMFVFPSSFEGFGLPAVEAMRLEIPLVITPEAALLEVTDGHATVMDGWSAAALADAVERAQSTTPEQLAAARRRAEEFTWVRMATEVRETLRAVGAGN